MLRTTDHPASSYGIPVLVVDGEAFGPADFLTTTQAAALLSARPGTVRRWAESGRFPGAEKWGRDWRIPTAAVEAFTKRPGGRPVKIAP